MVKKSEEEKKAEAEKKEAEKEFKKQVKFADEVKKAEEKAAKKAAKEAEKKAKAEAEEAKKEEKKKNKSRRLPENARHFCITCQDMTKYEEWPKLDLAANHIKYLIYQHELCPTTGKDHLQTYIEFKNARHTTGGIQKILGANVHIEARRGTRHDARKYCYKSDTQIRPCIELGTWTEQGERTDLEGMYEALKAGAVPADLMDLNPELYMRYYKAFDRVFQNIQSKNVNKFRPVDVSIIQGETGASKTRSVIDRYGPENVYTLEGPENGSLWFDGYQKQKILLIDEFYGWMPYSQLLRLTDGYCLRLGVKGSHAYSGWEKIYITSNVHPDKWYPNLFPDGMAPAFERRVVEIITLKCGSVGQHRKPVCREVIYDSDEDPAARAERILGKSEEEKKAEQPAAGQVVARVENPTVLPTTSVPVFEKNASTETPKPKAEAAKAMTRAARKKKRKRQTHYRGVPMYSAQVDGPAFEPVAKMPNNLCLSSDNDESSED